MSKKKKALEEARLNTSLWLMIIGVVLISLIPISNYLNQQPDEISSLERRLLIFKADGYCECRGGLSLVSFIQSEESGVLEARLYCNDSIASVRLNRHTHVELCSPKEVD